MAAGPATLMLILMLRLPESPRWLVNARTRTARGRCWNGSGRRERDVSGELQDIVEVEALEREAGVNRDWRGLGRRWVRPPDPGCGIACFTTVQRQSK